MAERSKSDEDAIVIDIEVTPEQSDRLEVLAVLRGLTVEELLQDAIDRFVNEDNGCKGR